MGSTRKLIKWGSSNTLIISLPRKWIKQNNLNANQVVKIQQNQNGTLTIIPQDLDMNKTDMETSVEIKDPDDVENIRLRIMTKYLDGWDIIKLTTKKEFQSDIRLNIGDIIEPLMGLEIFGVTPNEITIKNVLSVESSNVNSLVKMISNLTIELAKMLLQSIIEPKQLNEELGTVELENIRKYHYRITREQRRALLHPAILTKMELTLQDVLDFSFYVNSVFKIADSIRIMIETIKKHDIPQDTFGIEGYFSDILESIKDSIDSFLFKETSKAISIIKKIKKQKQHKREIENKVDVEEQTIDGCEPKLLSFQIILDVCEQILDYCEIVCLAALRRAI
ncbi:MAG: hypothetical protein GF364_14865 [Candidatus Lokiarchaeota archaeon]|nr:hypothetical protein [Candidatus Lokiarchaeota archaeon]